MSKRPTSSTDAASREDRLRAALRANLARRKAQGRARAIDDPDDNAGAQNGDQGGRSTAGPAAEPRQE
ncbi:hypothetical protein PE067_08840 [Paracoccus sp. DMF-8]|uniref:hypothetical protein n=1 Tax=Paracoccus sp. DMF-8 TaxID=3019445 RepID=UPI0023E8B00C|nr:hypothetical protein [Paracoccus sp. DMF-8]MDF3606228.1 hypothetical protein [Paracoccus sp. DMF-8]